MIGRPGDSIARSTYAFAGDVDLDFHAVETAVALKNSQGLARRGQGCRGVNVNRAQQLRDVLIEALKATVPTLVEVDIARLVAQGVLCTGEAEG